MSFAVGRRSRKNGANRAWRSEEPEINHAAPAPYFRWKDLPGRCLAFTLFLPGLPIMAATMLIVRLSSPGPAIYKQIRVGRNGRHFTMFKIRTMRVDAEAASGPVWTQQQDPRVTSAGRLIRKLHLDEFPQLINVLKGEMALIGPRPERPEFTQRLAVAIPGYLDRLLVRPGITGLAQINLPPDTDLDSVRRKLVLDLAYVREGCLSIDLRILACTFARLFGIKGARVTRLLGLERSACRAHDTHVGRFRRANDDGLDLETMTCESHSCNEAVAIAMERKNGQQTSLEDASLADCRPTQPADDEGDFLLDGPRLPR